MKRSTRLLGLGALYLVAHLALAAEPLLQNGDAESGESAQSAEDVIASIRTEVVVSDRLVNEFEPLAGSHRNAQNLVIGLRNAKPVKMTAGTQAQTEVNFTPPTRPMSFADIHKALSLAQAQLRSKRIDNPTPAQVKAALAGGDLPNADGGVARVIGILPLHHRGMSWEQIARALRLDAPKRMTAVETAAYKA